jgi:opacity protein-like surface antigen
MPKSTRTIKTSRKSLFLLSRTECSRWTKALLFLALVVAGSGAAFAQSDAPVTRIGDLQLGAGYSSVKGDYGTKNLSGFNIYASFDFKSWLGIEADFRDASAHDDTLIYERTYEIGPRFIHRYGRFTPYAKFLIGRGVFNYPPRCLDKTTFQPTDCHSSNVDPSTTGASANLAYNMYALGGGVDVRATRRINVRVDYEYQTWLSFAAHNLSPQAISIGAAYHFGGGNLSIR